MRMEFRKIRENAKLRERFGKLVAQVRDLTF